MGADTPLASLLIPVHDARPFVRAAVESALAQTWPALEVLVVDDGSTDGSLAALDGLDDPRLVVLRQENAGKSVALNRALEVARGEFFAVLDADDLCHPERVARQVALLRAEPDVAAAFCGYDLLVGGRRLAPRARDLDRAACAAAIERMAMPGHDPTALFRRALVDDLAFDPELRVGQGLDFVLRAGERSPLLVLGECLYSYRVHFGSNTRRGVERRLAYLARVFAKACERRGLPPERVEEQLAPLRALGGNRLRDNNLAAHFMESALDLRRSGRAAEALRTGLACARLHPFDPHYHKALLYSLLPLALVAKLRRTARAA